MLQKCCVGGNNNKILPLPFTLSAGNVKKYNLIGTTRKGKIHNFKTSTLLWMVRNMENIDISYKELRESLKKHMTEKDIETVIDVISELKYKKNRKTALTLKERADNGLMCGRPKFNKPTFFRAICIFHQLGYFDVDAIVKVFNICKNTFYKYERLENISSTELKNSKFKQPSQKQISLYTQSAERYVKKWIIKNKPPMAKNHFDDLKNDCLVSILLKLPMYDCDFGSFCYKACKDTYYSLREKYFNENHSEVLMQENWQLDKANYENENFI